MSGFVAQVNGKIRRDLVSNLINWNVTNKGSLLFQIKLLFLSSWIVMAMKRLMIERIMLKSSVEMISWFGWMNYGNGDIVILPMQMCGAGWITISHWRFTFRMMAVICYSNWSWTYLLLNLEGGMSNVDGLFLLDRLIRLKVRKILGIHFESIDWRHFDRVEATFVNSIKKTDGIQCPSWFYSWSSAFSVRF